MLIAPPAGLVSAFEPWASFYNDSKLAETLVTFAHVGGLVVAGGIAIATDRGTFRLAGAPDDARRRHLDEMLPLHRTVVTSLIVTMLSGLFMLAADIETFWGSWIFWAKMLLIALLLANGAHMQRVESRLRQDPSPTAPAWAGLRTSALASMALWLTITLAGVALLNYS